jgi:hypothetical protein
LSLNITYEEIIFLYTICNDLKHVAGSKIGAGEMGSGYMENKCR